MNTVKTNWNLGNFSVGLLAEVGDDVRDTLASLGLRFLGQRNSEVDKILGAFEKVNGKDVRKKLFKRNEVAYTAALAQALSKSFESLALPDSDASVTALCEIGEYIRDAVESKFEFEREAAKTWESAKPEDYDAWLNRIGFSGETHTSDGEDFSREYLLAIRERKLAVNRELDAERKRKM